jgi:hypothetical protein
MGSMALCRQKALPVVVHSRSGVTISLPRLPGVNVVRAFMSRRIHTPPIVDEN